MKGKDSEREIKKERRKERRETERERERDRGGEMIVCVRKERGMTQANREKATHRRAT